MAKAFNLTAELNLRGPANLKQIASAIRREIGTVEASVKVKIDRAAERSILGSANALNRLNRELETTASASARSTNNINSLVSALNGLSTALRGSDRSMANIVSSAQQTATQMARVRKSTVQARDEMEEFGRQAALAVRRFAAFNFATGVIYGLYNAVSKATSEFIEFDRQLVRLTQITGESYNQLSRITDTITGLSTGLGVASSDLIRISDTLAQAGLSARETDQALRALALSALAPSFDDLNNTVEGSIALMRQFKISTEDLDNALGSINAVAAGFAVEASDIITAIQRTGGVFAAASKGVSEGTAALNEFIAVFTSVRATTRESAETIATGLRTIFTRIQREDTIDALKEYGVNLLDVEGKFVGAYKAVQLLSEGLGKLDPRDTSFSRIVEELGGFRQIGKVLPLIQEFGTAQQALAVAQRGQNSLAADAVKAQASLAIQFSKTRESFVALIRDIGQSDSFQTLISLGLTLANTFVKVVDVARPLLPIITTIGAIKGAKALTSFVGGFVGGLKKIRPDDGGGPASAARNTRASGDVTDNSRYLDANTTALNNLGSVMGTLTGAITPLQASIDNLGNSAIAQLTSEVVALNNTISSTDFGGGGGTITANSGGRILKFAKGGSVPGTGRGDSVPSMLEPGEFVVNRKAVQTYGKGNLVAINKGQARKFAAGGLTEYFTIDELLGRSGSNTIKSILFPASNIEKSDDGRSADKAAIKINRRIVNLVEEDFKNIWDIANASASMGGGKYKSYEGVDVSPENRDRLRQIRQSDRRSKAPPATGESAVGKLMSAEGRWGKAYEEVLAAKLSGKWENASNQADYPVDLVRKLKDNSIDAIGEAKFRSIPTDDIDLVSKLLRYRINKKSVGSYFKEQSGGDSIDQAILGTLDYFWAEDQKKQFYQWIEKQRSAGIPGFNSGGLVQKFMAGGKALGARSKFKELSSEEIGELSTRDLIAYAKALAEDIFTTGGAGMAVGNEFIEVPPERIIPELESSLVSYMGKKGFWREKVAPFARPNAAVAKKSEKLSRESALEAQVGKYSDEVAARNQEWTKITSGSDIDDYLMSSLTDPILTDYKNARSGKALAKDFHNTRLRQAVNKALEQYDDFDYSAGNIDKLVSGMASERFLLGGLVPQRFMAGGIAELAEQRGQSLQETIIQELEALGKIAGVKKILGVGGGDRELDSLLRVSNLKQGKKLDEAAKVIDRALSAGNIQSAAEAERISRLPKVAVAGLVDSNNSLDYSKDFEWNIGTDKEPKNIYAYVRGFKGKYLSAVRQMQQETAESSMRLAENVQYADIFDGGPLALDFDETLVAGADILGPNGKPDIPQYSNRDAVEQALKKGRLTRLGAKLKSLIDEDPNFIRQTRILTARPQSTADLLAKTLQSFGLPYKTSDITGVSSATSTNIAAAKAANLAQTEKLIDDSLDNINAVSKSGKQGFLYTEPKAKPELDELMGQGNIEGAVIEKALALLGANLPPIDQLESNRAIDFPNGLGRAAQFFGLDPNLPTEIKRTLDGSAFERARNEFARYFLENPDIARFASGGIVSLFHGSNTGTNDSVLNSFKEKGALSNIATGYGQGAGFYVYTEKDRAVTQAKMRVAGGGFGTVVSGDTTGKPMVLTFNEALTPENYDLDYELQKSLIIKWMTENFDKIQPTLSMKDDAPISLLGKVDKNLEKGIMSSGIRVQEGSQTLTGDDGQQYTVQGGARRTLYSGTDGNVREGELIGKLMQRLTAGDPALVNEFESKLFEKPYGLVLKYVGQSSLKPSNIEILGDGNNQQPAQGLQTGGFAEGGSVPALLTPGEAVIGPKLAKKIGYGRLRRMNHADKNGMGRYAGGGDVGIVPGSGNTDSYGPVGLPVGSFVIRKKATEALGFNKGGAIGIQKFAMGGEALTGPELNQVRKALAEALYALPKELQDTIRNLKLPDIDTSSWDTIDRSLRKTFLGVNRQFDTLGSEVVEAVRFMTGEGKKALSDIELNRARSKQSEIASSLGMSSADIQRGREAAETAKTARQSVGERKRKNRERVAAGKEAWPELDMMQTMTAAVGYRPDPLSISATTPTKPETPQWEIRDEEYYRSRMNYSDVSGKDTAISDRGMQYAKELTTQDPGQVDALVKQMREMFSTAMSGMGQTPSRAGQSESWATWDIGKQLFMNNNPDKSSDKYRLGNPMQDPKLVLQMVQRMVGYEATGGGQRDGKANNIPSFELVDIGAKAMAESLGKNQAALDAFLKVISGVTAADVLGPGTPASPPALPTSPPPSGGSGSPPVPPTPPTPPKGKPGPGDQEASVQRYMQELEAAARATKLSTYQAERLAGATATEAKTRADAAAQAAAQALAQQKLVGATTEETVAIADAITRMNKVKGGVTLSRGDMNLQEITRGGAPPSDNTDYVKTIKDNIAAMEQSSQKTLLYGSGTAMATSALSRLVGQSTILGSTLDALSSSIGNTTALFVGFDEAIAFISKLGTSEDVASKLKNFSDYLIDAGRKVSNFGQSMDSGLLKGLMSRIGGGLDKGGGLVGKLAGNLPQIVSGITGSLATLSGPIKNAIRVFDAASSAFIAITDTLRRNKVEKATQALESSLKNASSALEAYNRNTIDNATQLESANFEINRAAAAAKTLADVDKTNPQWNKTNIIGETLALGGSGAESRAQRAEILDKKGMMAYATSMLDLSGRTQQQYSRELAPQQAIKSSEQFAKVLPLIQQQNEAKFKSGRSASDIMKDPGWAQQAEVLARANAATEEQLRLIDADISLSKSAKDARRQEIIQFAASNTVRQQEIQYIRQKNADEANQQSASLLYGLERMLNNMEQSINAVTYSLDKMADATDLFKASMTGEAKVGASRVDALNVLQNPNVYGSAERSKAADLGSQFFGSQAADMKGLLEFGPKIEETVLSSINSTLKENPNASSGKIEARISKNLEDQLGNLNIAEGLKQSLSKQMAGAITDSRTKGDEKKDFKQLFNETTAFGQTVQATKRAQEAAVKALEFYQQSIANYAQATNEMVSTQISSNERFRRASDIRTRGELDLAKALGKSVSFETTKAAARAGAISQAGTANPEAIYNNIGRLEQMRQSQQSSVDASAQKGPRGQRDLIAFNKELASTTMSLRENYAALKGLAESTEVAQAAMNKIGELKAKNEAGLNILERFVTSSPKDQAKLSDAFTRLERNMNGQTNNMWESARVQEAYNEAIQSGASMQEAQEAADSAAAQDRGDTLEAFKMLSPLLGDNQNQLKANMLESMMRESGTEMSPMFNKVIEGLRNPEGDPQMAEAINQYRQATELQAKANEYLARLDGELANRIGAQSQIAFTTALAGVQQAAANANAQDIARGINDLNTHLKGGVTKVTNVASGGKESAPFARGGVVTYKAVGGSIFKPKGTDTVPAMLTPGEFVVNRKAASENKGILTAINNGYAKGGPVQYLADGGEVGDSSKDTWVSKMLKPKEDRFKETKAGELYTAWGDFARFKGGDDVIKNMDSLNADSGTLGFIKPYSFPKFGDSSEDIFSKLSSSGSMKSTSDVLGILPDFYLSRQVVNKTLEGAGLGAAAGLAVRAGAAGSVASTGSTILASKSDSDTGTGVSSWLWEAMKFVPGLGAVISGIDAVRELFKGNFLGAALEGLSAVFNLVPIPGAGMVGKGITKALGWAIKWVPGIQRLAAAGGKFIPGIFQKFAPGLYDKMAGFLNGNVFDVIMKFIPNSIKSRLGMPSAIKTLKAAGNMTDEAVEASIKAGGAPTRLATKMGGEMIENAGRTAVRNAVPGLAAAGAVVGGGKALYDGATPVEVKSVTDKLKELYVQSNISLPKRLQDPELIKEDINSTEDHLSLTEAKYQEAMIGQWLKSLDSANEWEQIAKAPESQVSVSKGAYTTYKFGPTEDAKDKQYMYATISGQSGEILGALQKHKIGSAAGLLRFRTDGYPTLNSADPEASSITDQYLSDQGLAIPTEMEGKIGGLDISRESLRDYYNSLKEINAATTTPDKYNAAQWTPKIPSEAKLDKQSTILTALLNNTRFKYAFDKSEIKDDDKIFAGDFEKLTVYGQSMRSQWDSLIASPDLKNALDQKKLWNAEASNGFKIYPQGGDPSKYEPLPWTTDEGLIKGFVDGVKAQYDVALSDRIGLKLGTLAPFDEMISLPKSSNQVPVQFDFRPFEQIPLLDPSTTEITDKNESLYLPGAPDFSPSTTPSKGLFIINRGSKDNPGLNPFQSITPNADKIMPYYSNEQQMREAVDKWAANNFDIPDWGVLGMTLTGAYQPIQAEAAMKAAESVRSARTSRKQKTDEAKAVDAEGSAASFLLSEGALFYKDDFLSSIGPVYEDAKNPVISKVPKIIELLQSRASRQFLQKRDDRKAEIQRQAAQIGFSPEEIPVLGNAVWQKVKNDAIPYGPLQSAADWSKAASNDGVPPPDTIKSQDDMMSAIDYLSWVKGKILQIRQDQQNKGETDTLEAEAAVGKYMSAGRFLSQLASDQERVVSESTTIGQASERLYSYYGKSESGVDPKLIRSVKTTDKRSGKEMERKYWNLPEIAKDEGFLKFVLGFANQQRTAQRFKQLVTGNNKAQLSSDQQQFLQSSFNAFGQKEKASDFMSGKDKESKVQMKVIGPGGEPMDLQIPTTIEQVIDQFLDDSAVLEPTYRENLGKILQKNGETYAKKWTESGDPGTGGWATLWADYSSQLGALSTFLVNRDDLLMRPIAKEGSDIFPPAVLPAVTNIIPTLQNIAKQQGIPVPEVGPDVFMSALNDRDRFVGLISQYIKGATSDAPEDYKQRDQAKTQAQQIMDFYENNLSAQSLPRVYTDEGNALWESIKAVYDQANEAYINFSGITNDDAAVGLKPLSNLYNENKFPYAQNTSYGDYYSKNKKAGTNNSIDAVMRDKAVSAKAAEEAAKPKAETAADIPAQAVANAPSQPEPGLPEPPSTPEETARKAGEQETQKRAKGGLIYRADGGAAPVNWAPKGSDTVPAMLTPGEFVINRSSTQKYLPILEAINSGNATAGQVVTYASRGGVIKPKYFEDGGNVNGGSSGVSTSYSMGFDSATLAAIQQFDKSVQAFGEALAGLELGNVRIDDAALSALGDFTSKFAQFTESLSKLNVPPIIDIKGQHEVNVNINGASVINNMEEKMQAFIGEQIEKAFSQLSKETEGNVNMQWKPQK